MIPAVDAWPLTDRFMDCFSYTGAWDEFLVNIAARGYLLPGSLEDLGRDRLSYVKKWPDAGVNSSTVFARLQYHGEKMGTFNEIPHARFDLQPDQTEITVVMTNNVTYTMHPGDYERMSTLAPGIYTVTRCPDKGSCTLNVTATHVNRDINEAIRVMNAAIQQFNAHNVPHAKQRQIGNLLQKSRRRDIPDSTIYPDMDHAARLTRNHAMLAGVKLAVAYKLDGKNVPKAEALRHMSHWFTTVMTLFQHLLAKIGPAIGYYAEYKTQITRLLEADRAAYQFEQTQHMIADSPIAQAFSPNDGDAHSRHIWYPYWVEIKQDPMSGCVLLHVKSKADLVCWVKWLSPGKQAEIGLAQIPTNFFVAPLKPVHESEQHEEVKVGDLALLVGRYLIITDPSETHNTYPMIMMNWLEIKDATSHDNVVGRRRRNRGDAQKGFQITTFI